MRNHTSGSSVKSLQLSRRGFVGMGLALAGLGAALPAAALAGDRVGGIAGLIVANQQAEESVAEDSSMEMPEAPATEGVFDEFPAVNPMNRKTVVDVVSDSDFATSGMITVKVDNSNSNDTFVSFVLTVRVADADRFPIGDYECAFIQRGSEILFPGQVEERVIQFPLEDGAATYEIRSVAAELADYGKLPFEIVEFGSYPQGDNGEIAPIQWYVIDTREDGSRLLLSKFVLDNHAYFDDSSERNSWEHSAMRAWLNGEFIETAFTADEAARIAESKNPPSTNVMHGTDSGYGTFDRVFLLGFEDLIGVFSIPQPVYDHAIDSEDNYELLVSALATPYAVAQGVDTFSRSDVIIGDWALRTPGYSVDDIVHVREFGDISMVGDRGTGTFGVRPALALLP